jgi:ABC-type branched-subunit amino acid transport system substrate-binding protein
VRSPVPICLLLALLLAACAAPSVIRDGVRVPLKEAVDQDLRESTELIEAGDAEAARQKLEGVLREFPRGPRRDEALFLYADASAAVGDTESAARRWHELIQRYPRSRFAPAAHLRLAELYRDQGRAQLARGILRAAPFESADEELRAQMYRLLADLARSSGDFPDTTLWLAYARREARDPEEQNLIDLEVADLLEGRMTDAEIEALLPRLPRGPVHDRALLALARRAIERGDPEAARAHLAALPRRLRPSDELQREALLEAAELGAIARERLIGLAAPLSGPYARFGESVLRGVVLGLELYEDAPAPYRVIVRDTAGDPARAAAAVDDLARQGVAAIIGPLRSATSVSAAPMAQSRRVPLLTLAQREDLPFLGEFVFRLGLTASDQVRILIDHAFDARALRRFAVLYPRDEYGTMFKNLFWDEVERRGGMVVGVEAYDPTLVDHQVEIKKLVGLHYLTPAERRKIELRDRLARRPRENEERLASPEFADLPPHIDFDALFIPDTADKVGLILPQLRYYDVQEVALLGASGWNDPTLVEIAGRDARGAVFTDAFFARSGYPFVQEFVSRFYAAYGAEPDLLAAEGYDAATILRSLMDDTQVVSRDRLRSQLAGLRDFPGVSGLTSFDETGGTRKSLYLLTVRAGQIEELEGSR